MPNEQTKKRILIVEDEEAIRRVMAFRVEKAGYAVVSVADGRRAIEEASAQAFDLILLDMLMPKMSGFDVLRVLRKSGASRDAAVFVFSNLSNEVDVTTAKKFGIVAYIVKSELSLDEVIQRIRKFFKQK